MPRYATKTRRAGKVRTVRNDPASSRTGRRYGPARTFAIAFGIAYLAVALTEVLLSQFGNGHLMVGDTTLLGFALTHNLVHWTTGLLLVAAAFVTEPAARRIVLIIGFAFAAIALLGIFAPAYMGELMGHGTLPWSYNVIHVVTSVGALVAGFMHTMPTAPTRHSRWPRTV